MKTFLDIYSKSNLTKTFYLTIHKLDGKTEVKVYDNFKAVSYKILKEIPPHHMLFLEVVSENLRGSKYFLELVEHSEEEENWWELTNK